MSKEENVLRYYCICNKLKDVIRTGWLNWSVNKERVESVAEHIFGVQMLALAMNSEYEYNIDINKTILMIAIHELGEAIIGDLTPFDITKEEKIKKEHKAVHDILKDLIDGEKIEQLFLEFDEHKTKEAFFAYECDKLECDIQSKLYGKNVDLNNQIDNKSFYDSYVQELLKEYNDFSSMWIKYGQKRNNYDKNFMKVSNFILNNDLNF